METCFQLGRVAQFFELYAISWQYVCSHQSVCVCVCPFWRHFVVLLRGRGEGAGGNSTAFVACASAALIISAKKSIKMLGETLLFPSTG